MSTGRQAKQVFPFLGTRFSEQKVNQVIQAAAQEHFSAGMPHHLADGGLIMLMIAVRWAVLARWLGVHRAMRTLDHGVGQQSRALRAKGDGMPRDVRQIVAAQAHGLLGNVAVLIAAIKLDEQGQRFQIAP
jgi:hypothetical protein